MAESTNLVSVKLKRETVKKVRDNKTKNGVPIAVFIEQAIDEKLKRQSKKSEV